MDATAKNYFSPDYATARERFRHSAEEAGGRLTSLQLDAEGPHGEELTIDIAWFGAESPRRAAVHSSGLHGVEAFAGSAIQLELLDHGLGAIPEDGAIVLAHVLNPYGMAWLRRYNESNVDLNRNFLGEDEPYEGATELYRQLDSFLNPPTPPSRDMYYLRAGWLVLRHGMPALKQAIAGGQYENPKGLFFGGKRLEQGARLWRDWVAEHLHDVERLTIIDAHTGLGPFGEDRLHVESALEGSEIYDEIRKTFGERVEPLRAKTSVSYEFRGAHYRMFSRSLPEARVYFVYQEFGTDGLLKVVHALRQENRWHHYGDWNLDHPAKRALKEAFGPGDPSWRRKVLKRGEEVFRQSTVLAFGG